MLTSFTHSRFSGSRAPKAPRGFTLVELLVVLAIMSILTTVFLFQQRKFDSSTLLRTLAYSVALSMSQAQLYGSSVRQFSGGFTASYGVYFTNADPSHYYLFADAPPYDHQRAGDNSEDVQTFTIAQGYSIVKFCGISNSGAQSCAPGTADVGTGSPLGSLTTYFKRPNPDAQFFGTNTSFVNNGENYCAIYVQLSGPNNDTRTVKITATGQIEIGALGASITTC